MANDSYNSSFHTLPCRRAISLVVIASLLLQIGCAPTYKPPKRSDYFRAEPLAVEQTPPLHQGFDPYRVADPPIGAETPTMPVPPVVGNGGERPLSLEEAIRFGLGNSGVVRVLDGSGGSVAAATLYDPELADARARIPLAAFDPYVTSSVYSNWINLPPNAVFGPGLAEPTKRDELGFTAALAKPWITGGESRIAYNPPLGYLYLPLGTTSFNPLYTSNTEFSLRQPLLKGAGIDVNKAPIRIAHLQRDQTLYETKQAAMAAVRSITEAYWDLHASTAAAKAIEEVIPLLERVVQIEQERFAAQRSVRADVAKVESQLRAVRQQGIQARSAVVQRELRLRNLLGLPPSDGTCLVLTSQPLQAPATLDMQASTATAMELRPDLIRQRLAVRTRETALLAAKNAGLPQLDAVALYRWNGVGNQLGDALQEMYGTQYTDWQTSMTFTMPLGRRAAAAGIRSAAIQLSREQALLRQATHSAIHQINSLTQEAEYTYRLYAEANARLLANVDWLGGAKIRYENPPPAGESTDWLLAATNDYLSALRSQADAATDTQTFLARYNALLARLNEARGTILTDYGVEWERGEFRESRTVASAPESMSYAFSGPTAKVVGEAVPSRDFSDDVVLPPPSATPPPTVIGPPPTTPKLKSPPPPISMPMPPTSKLQPLPMSPNTVVPATYTPNVPQSGFSNPNAPLQKPMNPHFSPSQLPPPGRARAGAPAAVN
ncbi:MAG: TolC family protein [Planctomycetia bacterium]|nr:TolC family protein [Planctomycetia bacterium]